jgi:hypothetical protein
MTKWLVAMLALSMPALAQPAVQPTVPPTLGPSQADIDGAVRRGTLATLANICGLRDEAWAFDLRRSTILDATHAARPDDDTLRSAPGSQLVTTAMTYAETEALEDFAEAPADVTCEPLRRNPDLAQADKIVREFRALKMKLKPTS